MRTRKHENLFRVEEAGMAGGQGSRSRRQAEDLDWGQQVVNQELIPRSLVFILPSGPLDDFKKLLLFKKEA